MRNFIFLSIIFFFSLLFLSDCSSRKITENISVSASLDTALATIGDEITYTVNVKGIVESIIRFPQLHESADFDVKSSSVQDVDNTERTVSFIISVWDTGRIEIPEYSVKVLNPDSTLNYSIELDPLIIHVSSIMDQIDTPSQGIKPIKSPVPVKTPLPYRMIIYLVIIGLLIVSLIYLWRLRQPRLYHPLSKPKIQIPADVIAFEKIERLKQSDLGDIKEFYSELSYLLREYIENSFYLKSLEMTTTEIHLHSEFLPFSDSLKLQWIDLLQRADMIKYAKHIPAMEKCKHDLNWTESFIQETIPFWKTQDIVNDK